MRTNTVTSITEGRPAAVKNVGKLLAHIDETLAAIRAALASDKAAQAPATATRAKEHRAIGHAGPRVAYTVKRASAKALDGLTPRARKAYDRIAKANRPMTLAEIQKLVRADTANAVHGILWRFKQANLLATSDVAPEAPRAMAADRKRRRA